MLLLSWVCNMRTRAGSDKAFNYKDMSSIFGKGQGS